MSRFWYQMKDIFLNSILKFYVPIWCIYGVIVLKLFVYSVQLYTGNYSCVQLSVNIDTSDGSCSTLWANSEIALKTNTTVNGELPFVWADLIQAILPNEKIIIILRNPTNRTISGYFAFPSYKKSPEDFHRRIVNKIDALDACLLTRSLKTCANVSPYYEFPRIWVSIYVAHVREWMRLYPKKQLMIIRTEDWHYHKHGDHLQRVFKFLDIDPLSEPQLPQQFSGRQVEDLKIKTVTAKGMRENGAIFAETRELLNRFYEPYNKQLADLLNDTRFLWKDV